MKGIRKINPKALCGCFVATSLNANLFSITFYLCVTCLHIFKLSEALN